MIDTHMKDRETRQTERWTNIGQNINEGTGKLKQALTEILTGILTD